MRDEMRKNICWLGDPNVTFVSDDGHQLMCHQTVLGIYNENFRPLLVHDKMKEYMLILQDTNHLELIEFMHQIYSSFDTIIQKSNHVVLMQNPINEDGICEGSLEIEDFSKMHNIFKENQSNYDYVKL